MNSSVPSVGSESLVKIADTSISSTSEGSNGLFATDGGAKTVKAAVKKAGTKASKIMKTTLGSKANAGKKVAVKRG